MTSPWTPELKQVVIDNWGKVTASEIAGHLSLQGHPFTRNAVIGIAHRAGLTIEGATGRNRPNHSSEFKLKSVSGDDVPVGSTAFKVINGIKRRKKQPKIAAEPFACQDVSDIEPLHLGLMDLNGKTCRWPFGEGPFSFCGHDVSHGSYCFPHFRLSVGDGTPSEQAAHKISRTVT